MKIITDMKDGIKKNKIKYRLIWLTIAIACFIGYGVIQSLYVIPKNKQIVPFQAALIIAGTIAGITLIWALYYVSLRRQNNWNFSKIYSTNFKNLGIAFSGLASIILVQLLIVSSNMGSTSTNQNTLSSFISKSNPIFIIMLAIVAPITEELIFRGLFYQIFFLGQSRRNLVIGSIVNGIIFALLHDTNFDIFWLDYWFTGFVLSVEYLSTKNISTPMITHIANNILVLII